MSGNRDCCDLKGEVFGTFKLPHRILRPVKPHVPLPVVACNRKNRPFHPNRHFVLRSPSIFGSRSQALRNALPGPYPNRNHITARRIPQQAPHRHGIGTLSGTHPFDHHRSSRRVSGNIVLIDRPCTPQTTLAPFQICLQLRIIKRSGRDLENPLGREVLLRIRLLEKM